MAASIRNYTKKGITRTFFGILPKHLGPSYYHYDDDTANATAATAVDNDND